MQLEPSNNPQQPESNTDEQVEIVIRERAQRPPFEDLTLAEALGQLFVEPKRTWRQIHQIATTSRTTPIHVSDELAVERPAPVPIERERETEGVVAAPASQTEFDPETQYIEAQDARQREALTLGLRLTAFLIAWAGNASLTIVARSGRSETVPTGLMYVGIALLVWLGAEIYGEWPNLRRWWANWGSSKSDAEEPPPPEEPAKQDAGEETLLGGMFHPVRLVLAGIGAVALFVTITMHLNVENRFTLLSFFTWMLSITAFAGALASDEALFKPRRWHIPPFWRSRTFYALLAIVLVGAYFRLAYLERTPPQMTSDHVEKLLDAQRVLDGQTQVFFPNNGGREPFQMYAMALLSLVPGLNMDFFTLKLLSALEGIITLPFLWWMGREVTGEEYPRFGNVVGLVLAALVAVSGWHLALSRLALRIVLTPLIAALVLIYLGRGMRFNRRDDWLRAGLILGAGLYMYQAVRMLPVVIIVGLLLAVIARARTHVSLMRYAANFTSLVFISFVTFTPMFIFSLQAPDLFWRRTAGRLFGDSTIEEVLEDGTVVARDPTIAEQLEAFRANLHVLADNVKNVLLMFNYKGDVAWINNAPNYPQMDDIVGALFLLGLLAWLIRMIRRRDVVDWLVPMMLFIMLMPSALAIAYPVENPSATRTSGALPVAYLIAAYPVALMVRSIMRLSAQRWLTFGLSGVLLGSVAFGSYLYNSDMYFTEFHQSYLLSSLPYEQAGDRIEVFNAETGTLGNTFMIAHPYWWDHRALGIAGGMIDYPNGIETLEGVPQFLSDSYLRVNKYRFDPNQDILFFHSTDDTETLGQLRDWFPNGQSEFVEVESQRRSYAIYRVPALGDDRFFQFLTQAIPGGGIE